MIGAVLCKQRATIERDAREEAIAERLQQRATGVEQEDALPAVVSDDELVELGAQHAVRLLQHAEV